MLKKKSLCTFPKVILHSHLVGSAPASAFHKLACRHGSQKLSEYDSDVLYTAVRKGGWSAFIAMITRLSEVVRSSQDLSELVVAYSAELAKQHVIYAELYCTPWTHYINGLPLDEISSGLLEGTRSAALLYGVELGILIDLIRTPDEDADKIVDWLISLPKPPFVGLGISGSPHGRPLNDYTCHCQSARTAGYGVVVHAGELDGVHSVETAVTDLGADRIGHGVRVLEDPDLTAEIIFRQVHLELCPTSNACLGVINDPFGAVEYLFRMGAHCSINPDDDLLFNTSLITEMEQVLELTSLSLSDLLQMQIRAIMASFAHPNTKRRLLKTLYRYNSSQYNLLGRWTSRPSSPCIERNR